MIRRHFCHYYEKVYSPKEIKLLNKTIKKNFSTTKDRPATGVTKTATVGLFPITTIPLFYRMLDLVLEINLNNFGYHLHTLPKSYNAHYNIYDEQQQGQYDWHFDSEWESPSQDIKLTAILNLSEKPYEGGELFLATSPVSKITPINTPGNLVIFPSFLLHRVTPVTKGERISAALLWPGPKFH